MILILGGTTEGRVAVRVADEAAATYYYSTKGTLQSIECAHGIRLTGAMNAEEMECFCRDHAIKPVSYTHLDVYKRQPCGKTLNYG